MIPQLTFIISLNKFHNYSKVEYNEIKHITKWYGSPYISKNVDCYIFIAIMVVLTHTWMHIQVHASMGSVFLIIYHYNGLINSFYCSPINFLICLPNAKTYSGTCIRCFCLIKLVFLFYFNIGFNRQRQQHLQQ